MRLVTTFLIGLLFGLGIVISGMGNPAKVLNFFDVAGAWDPSLILVMGGALIVTFVGYRLVLPRPAPLFAAKFSLPTSNAIDLKLLGGSATFGIGWGMTGFCPGGALPVLGTGVTDVFIFCAAMMVGLLIGKSGVAATTPPGATQAPFKT